MIDKNYDHDNVFAKILRGDLPCKKVYEDNEFLAFYDKYPDAPIHILVIPKKQCVSYDEFILQGSSSEIVEFFKVIKNLTHKYGLERTGYRLVINHGENGEQAVPHFHAHILGGKKLGKHVSL